MAFSSTMFVDSEYAESSNYYNKDVALACAERASGSDESGISFVSKSITNESFYSDVTSAKTTTVGIIFIGVIPAAVVAICIIIYIRRKNAQ